MDQPVPHYGHSWSLGLKRTARFPRTLTGPLERTASSVVAVVARDAAKTLEDNLLHSEQRTASL